MKRSWGSKVRVSEKAGCLLKALNGTVTMAHKPYRFAELLTELLNVERVGRKNISI